MVFENGAKRVTALIFVIFLFVGFLRNDSYMQVQTIADYLGQDIESLGEKDALSIKNMEYDYTANIPKRREWIDLNGRMAKWLKMKNLYSNMGMYITDDLYILSASPYTSTDYEYEQTIEFKKFLDENGIHLLYVNEPTKYMDDSLLQNEFGVETYSNRNMDTFLSRINGAGVHALDLREKIRTEGINISDLFYRTDHHWTAEAALWASEKIAEGLNEHCGYHIDLSIYDEENFSYTEWKACWLGEQGRKVGGAYVGLDDYTEIKPKFPTDYTFKSIKGDYSGTFDDFIDESIYDLEADVYKNRSWHYSYDKIDCVNNNVNYGKILILGDSYEQVTEPFLSLGVHAVDTLVLRDYDPASFDLRNHILENGYDTVIICYAQFMVGAHDKTSSANYRMFTFE